METRKDLLSRNSILDLIEKRNKLLKKTKLNNPEKRYLYDINWAIKWKRDLFKKN